MVRKKLKCLLQTNIGSYFEISVIPICFATELITLEPIEIATGMYKRDILDHLIEKDVRFNHLIFVHVNRFLL